MTVERLLRDHTTQWTVGKSSVKRIIRYYGVIKLCFSVTTVTINDVFAEEGRKMWKMQKTCRGKDSKSF